jgi:hypothetical protein
VILVFISWALAAIGYGKPLWQVLATSDVPAWADRKSVVGFYVMIFGSIHIDSCFNRVSLCVAAFMYATGCSRLRHNLRVSPTDGRFAPENSCSWVTGFGRKLTVVPANARQRRAWTMGVIL